MEPEILKFEDIIRGSLKRWKSIVIFSIFTAILAAIVSGTSDEVITYQGNFKTLIRSEMVLNENGISVKTEPNLVQNVIELMKTRNFAENALKRTDLNLTPQQVLANLTLVNIEKSDFVQVKYLSDDKEETTKIITAIKDELLDIIKDYNEDAIVTIEENVGITEKTDIRNNELLVVIGFVGGLGLAFAVSFILECINKTFRTKGELERELKKPIIANIPKVNKKNEKLINSNEIDKDYIKAFNNMAAEVKYSKANSELKSILVTSSIRGEGSTTVAINLALALSNSNKTLLIDANYENSEIGSLLNINSKKGLTDIILNKANFEDVIVKSDKNLDVITTGDINVNGISLLDSREFDNLLENLLAKYEYIIIDTAALQASAESKILLRKVDGNILVVKAESTNKDIIKSSLKIIESFGANLVGISFNFGDRFRNKYYTYKK